MTEDEAKTKWCPFVRLSAPVDSEAAGTAGNRFGDDVGGNFRCIGSACMAWRWDESKRTAAFLEAVQAHMGASAKPNFNTAVQAVYAEKGGLFERTEGRCGLAGAA